MKNLAYQYESRKQEFLQQAYGANILASILYNELPLPLLLMREALI